MYMRPGQPCNNFICPEVIYNFLSLPVETNKWITSSTCGSNKGKAQGSHVAAGSTAGTTAGAAIHEGGSQALQLTEC